MAEGYGKRPLWQWILIYVAIGAVVYGVVYYFVLAKKGGSNPYSSTSTPSYQTPSSVPNTQTAPTSAPNTQTVPGY